MQESVLGCRCDCKFRDREHRLEPKSPAASMGEVGVRSWVRRVVRVEEFHLEHVGRGDVQGRAAAAATSGSMLLFAATAAAVKRRRVLVQSAKRRVLPVTSLFQKGRLGALRYEYSSLSFMKYAVSKRTDVS